jgi:alkanesulfonate monooxygenase SsuD/methylene tetrahydromethanopterin reductase-like flavin-dependent oxidoreductase (luciferase family)
MMRGRRGRLPAPIDDIEAFWSPQEKAHVEQMLSRSYVGTAEQVRAGLAELVAETGADELILAAAIHDHGARVRSYGLLANPAVAGKI